MLKDLKILCQGYDWSDTIPIEDCNFFSGETYSEIGDLIDLKHFCLDSEIKINKQIDDAITGGNGQPSIYFLAQDINLTLTDKLDTEITQTGLTSGSYLQDYFYLYSNNTDYDRVKFLITIYDGTTIIFRGIIARETIEETFSSEDSNYVIKLTILDYIKEFKEYYKTLGLIGTDELIFTADKPSGGKSLALFDVLDELFPVVTVTIAESSITDFRVSEVPEFYQSATGQPLWFQRCGYYNVWQCKENRFDFLYKLCMSMGWIFYLEPDDTDTKLIIRNRKTFDAALTLISVDKSDIISANVSQIKDLAQFENLMILNGSMIGGDNAFPNGYTNDKDHRGERFALISEKNNETNYGLHFSAVTKSGSAYTLTHSTNDVFQKYHTENEKEFVYSIFTFSSSTANTEAQKRIDKLNTLFINAGDNGDVRQRVQLTDGGQAAWRAGDTYDSNDLIFSGCYGEMLFQISGSTPYLYQDYIMGEAFGDVEANQLYNNYEKFLLIRNSKLLMEISLSEGYLDINSVLQISSNVTPYNASVDNKWIVTSLETDLVNEITKFKVSGVEDV